MDATQIKSKYEASSTMLAFHFQIKRALHRIFSPASSSSLIGIETLDDVAEITNDNNKKKIIWEQDKFSSQDQNNPFQNSSRNLWHTIRIWIEESVTLKNDYPEMLFVLVTNQNIPMESLVIELSNASSDKELTSLITKMKKISTETENDKLKEDFKVIFSFPDDHVKFVLKNTCLYLSEKKEEQLSSLKDKTILLFQLPSSVLTDSTSIYQSLLGELMDSCENCWYEHKLAWFKPQQFKDRLRDEIKRRELDKYIDRDLFSTGFKKYLQEESNDHFFVKQLAFLSLTEDELDDQLKHYWGFYSERIRLMEEGDVLEKDWHARDRELLERWKICRRNARLECGNDPEILGRKVFTTTLDTSYTGKLGLYNIEHLYFTHGQYHFLANDPVHECYVYWHDNFKKENLNKNSKE